MCKYVICSVKINQFPHRSGEIICEAGSSCDINKHESNESADRESDYPSISSSSSMDTVLEISNIEELNKSLMSIESPIKKRKIQQNDTPVKSFKSKRLPSMLSFSCRRCIIIHSKVSHILFLTECKESTT